MPTISGLATGHHWKKPASVLFCSLPSGISIHWWDPPEPSCLQARQSQLCQSFLLWKVSHSLTHFCGPSAMWPLQSLVLKFFSSLLQMPGSLSLSFCKLKVFSQWNCYAIFPLEDQGKLSSSTDVLMISDLVMYSIPSQNDLKLAREYNYSALFILQSLVQSPVYTHELKHIWFPSSMQRNWGLLLHLETRAETADGSCISFAADSCTNSV